MRGTLVLEGSPSKWLGRTEVHVEIPLATIKLKAHVPTDFLLSDGGWLLFKSGTNQHGYDIGPRYIDVRFYVGDVKRIWPAPDAILSMVEKYMTEQAEMIRHETKSKPTGKALIDGCIKHFSKDGTTVTHAMAKEALKGMDSSFRRTRGERDR